MEGQKVLSDIKKTRDIIQTASELNNELELLIMDNKFEPGTVEFFEIRTQLSKLSDLVQKTVSIMQDLFDFTNKYGIESNTMPEFLEMMDKQNKLMNTLNSTILMTKSIINNMNRPYSIN